MKKRALALLLSLFLLLGIAACGAASDTASSETSQENGSGKSSAAGEAPADYSGIAETDTEEQRSADAGGAVTSDKIIYSAYARIETRDFEASLEGVNALIERYEGFLESSSVTGNNYSSSYSSRSAYFVIRIPSEHFEELTGSLTELGNVPYSSTDAQNITARYNDTQSRLDAYEIEYERLLSMLEKAETVEEMLSIEERLSDIRYNIESLSNTLSSWDSLINYSSVEIELEEVVEYTDQPVETENYWEEVSAAFSASLKSVGRFFKNLFKAVVAFLPVLIILVPLAVIVVLAARKINKHRGEKPFPSRKGDQIDKSDKKE